MAIKNAYRDRKNLECGNKPSSIRRNWESKFGCCCAVSLSIFEIKRLILLTLEMLVDTKVIRFADAMVPVVFSFVDVGLGFPIAVAAVYAVRKHRVEPCYPNTKRLLRRIALILTICAILNIITVILIACHVDVKPESLQRAFRTSMRFYATNASYKITIDELQLDLQCCGFKSYVDWFYFDWQGIDYIDSEDREEYGTRSVPYSCCSRKTLLPCIHVEMRKADANTVNSHGCAIILSRILFKIAIVGYTMTSLIMCAQFFIIIFLIRIIRKLSTESCSSNCSCWDSPCPIHGGNISFDECSSICGNEHSCEPDKEYIKTMLKPRKICRRPRIIRKICKSTTTLIDTSPNSTSWSSDSSSSSTTCPILVPKQNVLPNCGETASIVPSAQTEHKVPQRRNQGP